MVQEVLVGGVVGFVVVWVGEGWLLVAGFNTYNSQSMSVILLLYPHLPFLSLLLSVVQEVCVGMVVGFVVVWVGEGRPMVAGYNNCINQSNL